MNCSPCASPSNYTSASTIQNLVTVEGNIYDTFSRLVTETPVTMLTSHVSFTPQYEIMGYASTGTGTVFVDLSNSVVQLSTTGSGASRAFRQTLEYQLYQPGKAHQAFLTWTPQYKGTFDTSVAVRCGIYDDYRDKNTPAGLPTAPSTGVAFVSSIYGGLGQETSQPSYGHFFELSGNQWFVVERANSPNNILNVTRVAQSNWNMDTLNPAYGRNPSGVTLQRTTEGLFWIERQWLGVGVVNMGIYNMGTRIIAHQFGGRGIKIPYTSINKIPLRTEIEKVTGGSSDPAATASICWASQIDGDYTPVGAVFSLPLTVIAPTTRVGTTQRPVLLLRLQQQYCRATFKIKNIELYGAAAGIFNVLKNPTITGTITWVNHPDKRSMIQYAVFADGTTEPTNTISGGQILQSGFFEKRTSETGAQSVADLIAAPSFCSDIRGAPDVFCIGMAGFSANDDVNATAQWIEIT